MHSNKAKGRMCLFEKDLNVKFLNIECFEYPLSDQLHGEWQIVNVQYQKQSGFTLRYCVLVLGLPALHIADTRK